MKPQEMAQLIAEIGGPEKVQLILEKFYQVMAQDILVGFFFSGKDLSHIIQKQKEFILYYSKLEKSYDGKLPAKAHSQIPPILAGHFDRRIVILEEVLKEFEIPSDKIKVWVSFERQFRKAIVSPEK